MDKKITVYSSPTCHFCDMLKDWLNEKNIKFEEKDVSSSEEAVKELMDKSKQMGVPVSIIRDKNGKETIVVGFDPEKIKKALKQR